jgi:uncharacterized RDD family membrane protein YckC
MEAAPVYAGVATRAVALALDAVIVNAVAVLVGAVVGLCVSLVSPSDGLSTALLAVGGAVFVIWVIGYFVTFWSTTGQTPGNRVMRIRVGPVAGDGAIRPRRACLRLVGMVLAALPLMLGYLPILVNDRRRGLHDFLARTVVTYDHGLDDS